jgi:hypothetical protein
MILFQLRCARDHEFEGWFRDGRNYESQRKAGKIVCPVCNSRKVEKAPMAPRIAKGARMPVEKPAPTAAPTAKPAETPQTMAVKALRELRSKVEANCDYVGPAFAEEARRIHYGETEPRGIYGETSDEEAEALDEEGIEFAKIPWVPRHDG